MGRTKAKRRRKPGRSGRLELRPTTADRLVNPYGVTPRNLEAVRRRLVVQLGDDGELGYCMRRSDDCLQAAIATAIQVPIEQLPDPRLDARRDAGDDREVISRESWERIDRWLSNRGLELTFHETPPARERWVAVFQAEPTAATKRLVANHGVDWETSPPFTNHCLVMAYGEILFDPGISLKAPRGTLLRRWHPSEVAYGLSFDRKDTSNGSTS